MTRKHDAGLFSSAFSSLKGFLAHGRHGRPIAERPKTRTLRIEPCESRRLLAVLSGAVYEDLTGDGASPANDPVMEGVTIELYRDDGDGVFSPADGDPVDTQVSDDTGAYSFEVSSDGRYFLRQEESSLPSGLVPSAGYTIDVVEFSVGRLIDDFQAPETPREVFITLDDPDPTLVETPESGPLPLGARIVGGQRDLLIDVIGVPTESSAQLSVGGGTLGLFTGVGEPGTQIVLQYDGIDDDVVGPPAELLEGRFPPTDVTSGGTNTGFRIDFDFLEVGPGMDGVEVKVLATSENGGLAEFVGLALKSTGPTFFVLPFAGFTPTGDFSFREATSLKFVFNELGRPDVDLSIRSILAVNPNSDGLNFANFQPPSVSGTVYRDLDGDGFPTLPTLPTLPTRLGTAVRTPTSSCT